MFMYRLSLFNRYERGVSYKSMPNKLYNNWQSNIIFILLVAMLLSLFISRAALSVSMMLFAGASFFHTGIKKQVAVFLLSPLLWGMSLLFFLPLLSGFWSNDIDKWMEIVRIKLPLLLLPLAFAGPFKLSVRRWNWLAGIFITIITAGTIWSMIQYSADISGVQAAYLKAKTIATPLHNDHIRFSWLVSVAVLLAAWLCIEWRKENKKMALVMGIVTAWLIFFLHLLAVRTGLFSFYGILLLASVWLSIKKMKQQPGGWKYGLAGLVLLMAFPVLAWLTLPTFQNRVKYFRYDYSYFSNAQYLPRANDAMRVISIKAGWNLLNEEPLKGVGFGDVQTEVNAWYANTYPQMVETDKIYPASEWLVYGAGAGWPGLFLFTGCMGIPFFVRVKNKSLWWLLNISAAGSFLFDIGLEVQYGVFAYSFIVLWWWKWKKPIATGTQKH
jgi:O-antigen ligase